MKKRKLGNTDIELTSIGFGGAPLGNLFEELNETDCFNIIADSGLIMYETITGDFRSGIEIINYDKKKGVIKWELIKTSRKTNSFRIISKNRVEFDNGNRRVNLYRQRKK